MLLFVCTEVECRKISSLVPKRILTLLLLVFIKVGAENVFRKKKLILKFDLVFLFVKGINIMT